MLVIPRHSLTPSFSRTDTSLRAHSTQHCLSRGRMVIMSQFRWSAVVFAKRGTREDMRAQYRTVWRRQPTQPQQCSGGPYAATVCIQGLRERPEPNLSIFPASRQSIYCRTRPTEWVSAPSVDSTKKGAVCVHYELGISHELVAACLSAPVSSW